MKVDGFMKKIILKEVILARVFKVNKLYNTSNYQLYTFVEIRVVI